MANSRLCSIPDCGKTAFNKRGWCSAHYARWRKHGDPTAGRPTPQKPSSPNCSVDGCEKQHYAFGLCVAHYAKKRKYGDPNTKIKTSPGEPIKFIREVAVPYGGDECLEWPFGKVNGYGTVHHNGKNTFASRVVCEEVNGPPPTPKHEAAHSCGNGHLGCVAPNHLRWATSAENCSDRRKHGTFLRGEKIPLAKLKREDVIAIRSLAGKATQSELSAAFGVSQGNISMILSNRSWGWLVGDLESP